MIQEMPYTLLQFLLIWIIAWSGLGIGILLVHISKKELWHGKHFIPWIKRGTLLLLPIGIIGPWWVGIIAGLFLVGINHIGENRIIYGIAALLMGYAFTTNILWASICVFFLGYILAADYIMQNNIALPRIRSIIQVKKKLMAYYWIFPAIILISLIFYGIRGFPL